MELTRREALLGTLFGTGWIGLRSLATGLPISFLLDPRAAVAATAAAGAAQFLVLSTSGAGDPMGCNVPGMYPDAYSATNKVAHPPAVPGDDTLDMAPTAVTVGGKSYQAAKPWSTLDAAALARPCFFHHTTLTNNQNQLDSSSKRLTSTLRGVNTALGTVGITLGGAAIARGVKALDELGAKAEVTDARFEQHLGRFDVIDGVDGKVPPPAFPRAGLRRQVKHVRGASEQCGQFRRLNGRFDEPRRQVDDPECGEAQRDRMRERESGDDLDGAAEARAKSCDGLPAPRAGLEHGREQERAEKQDVVEARPDVPDAFA